MSGVRSIKRGATIVGSATGTSAPIYVDSDDNILKFIPAGSGTTEVQIVDASSTQTLTNKTIAAPTSIADDSRFGLGTDSDGVLYLRTTILATNTALTNVMIGTPVTPAIAANSLIVSNVTASGDYILALNNGGNSQAWHWVDSSAGTQSFYGAGTEVAVLSATAVEIEDGILLTLGNDQDQVLINRTTILATNTALTGVVIGTPVTPAIAANSLIVSNTTASGDYLLVLNNGGNSQAWHWVDASAGTQSFYGAGTEVAVLSATAVEVEDGILLALGNDQDQVLLNRASTLGANTALTGVLIGTPVTPALAANSLIIANATSNGDILLAVNDGGNSKAVFFADGSADTTYLYSEGLSALVLNDVQDVLAVGGLLMDTRTSTTVSTDSNVVYTIAQMLGGIITRDSITANRVDAVDTAANIVAGIPGAVAGMSFEFVVNNNDDASTITVNGASTGITYEGTATALAAGDAWIFRAVLTNVTAASEAVTIYQFAK